MGKPVQRLLRARLTSALIAVLSLSSFAYGALDNTELELGKSSSYHKLKDNEVKYFMVRIDEEVFTGEQDLVIKVQAQDFSGDPDLYISKKVTKPNSKENSDQQCATYGKDICSVGHKSLTAGQYMYIGVKCLTECKFSLRAALTEQVELDDSEEKQLEFEAEESKIFKFYVPAKSAAQDDQNRVNAITITAVPLLTLNDNILLAASTKRDAVPNSSSRKGVPGWRKGQVLRLSDSNPEDWCNDCWITILVDVSDAGKYSIMAKSNVGVLQLQTDKKVDEVAFFGDKTCYKYYVQSAEHDMVLKVQQFSGLISFTVNPKKPAESYDTAKFKHVSSQNSNLLITSNERQKAGQQKGLYYICAVPHMTSTFSLLVTEPSKFQIFSYLEDGYDENGEIQGKNMTLLVYKVPPLEYQGEDIQLNFRLNVISGEKPILAAKFCQDGKDHRKCAINQTAESILGSRSSYKKANIVGKDLYLVIDHDERTCQDVYNGECYYVIAIIGQAKEEEFTKYEIKVTHSQLNYELLSEGSILTDYVDMGLYRHYSFTLLQDPKVKKVSFRLNTLHGDADIFVSRKHRTPNKIDYEKSSVKTGAMIDEVYFDDNNLATTYYIGVYSFQYSTYNLVVKVERDGQASQDNIPQLSEGIPYSGSIRNEKGHDNYRLVIKQLEGYEKSIKIQAQQIKGKVDFYVNYGEPATDKKHIWASKSGVIDIATTHKSFKREGTYFIAVYPRASFWSKFTDDTYSYMISYSTKDTYTYVQSSTQVESTQKTDTYQYFRHFVTQKTSDITVSMTVYSGNPQLYLSVNPSKKQPTASEHEFNTWKQPIINGNKGKAIHLSNQQLQKSNSVCSSSISTNADVEPCAVYMGVYCDADCKYSLKLSYRSDTPQQLVIGMPQHDIVKQGEFKYYYIIVRENKTKQIYAVLNSLAGNADLYVRYQENPHTKSPENWVGPITSDYAVKSTDLFKEDMVVIKPENLKDCFLNFKTDGIQDETMCAIIFGVYSPSNSDSDDQPTRYNFVVYSDVTYISNGASISGKVDENEFQYYIFDALCADCPIVVSVSTFSSGDPDLYIKFGDAQLPTTTSFDVQSATFMSELIRIDLEDPQIKAKGIKSFKGTMIVGVYGKKKSEYQISVNQEKNPITPLNAGLSLKVSQQAFETTYFMYYHAQKDVDFKISIAVKSGKVDLLMSTFEETKESQNFASRLPKSKRNSQWQLDGISSISKTETKELIVVNNERNYCSNCFYLIGISSQEQRTEYSILVHNMEADFNNSLLLKVGETYQEEIKKDQLKSYKFVIDEYQNFQVLINMVKGYAYSYLNLVDSKEDPLYSTFSTSSIQIKKDDPNFHTGRIYYLILEGNTDCEFSILVQQESHAITLSDGIPTKVQFISAEDTQKNFLFHLPEGDSRISLQLKTLSDGFYPYMYYRLYEDIDSVENIEYPPAGPHNFYGSERWDRNFKIMNYDRQFNGIKGQKAVLAFSISAAHTGYDLSTNPSMILTISQSSIIKMLSGQMYTGRFKHGSQQLIYSSDDFLQYQQGFISIEFSACVGEPTIDVVNDPDDKYTNTMTEFKKTDDNGRLHYFIPLPRKNLYILVRPEPTLNTGSMTTYDTQFLIKVKYAMFSFMNQVNYQFQGGNTLQYSDYSIWAHTVNLTWGKLLWADQMGGIRDPKATYSILISTKDKIRLDSVCALRQNISNEIYYKQYNSDSTSFILPNISVGVKYYVNVYGNFKTTSDSEAELVPYNPIVLYIEGDSVTSFSQICKLNLRFNLYSVIHSVHHRNPSHLNSVSQEMHEIKASLLQTQGSLQAH